MKPSEFSLKSLEVFSALAKTGSVQTAARETELSIGTASHHLRKLESCIGTPLFDHAHRPLRVTPAGAVFQQSIDQALQLIRKAETEAKSGTVPGTRRLSLALIEDFDTEIAPELARLLNSAMPRCQFRHLTRASHDILQMLRDRSIDIGVASRPNDVPADLVETPILRDPFVVALPASSELDAKNLFQNASELPFLRYSANQIMAAQIEQQLRRLRKPLPAQHEFDSNQTLMALVANGTGWTITTPTNFMRARVLHRDIKLEPFPGKDFSRTISAFTTELSDLGATRAVTETLRRLIENRAVKPCTENLPWLKKSFRVLSEHD
ncbi:MAG: LysR family transcriptional regulator [Pseudomonadota bacterium]